MSHSDTPISIAELVRLLSPTLGQPETEAPSVRAIGALELPVDRLPRSDARCVIERITDQVGSTGIKR